MRQEAIRAGNFDSWKMNSFEPVAAVGVGPTPAGEPEIWDIAKRARENNFKNFLQGGKKTVVCAHLVWELSPWGGTPRGNN